MVKEQHDMLALIEMHGLAVRPVFDKDDETGPSRLCWSAGKADARYGILNQHYAFGLTMLEAVQLAVKLMDSPWPSIEDLETHMYQVKAQAKAIRDTK